MTLPAPCPSANGMLALQQTENPGQGRPLYSKNHYSRQRRSVREMLCPMCGEPTEAGDRWSQTGRWITARDLRAHGMGAWLPVDMSDDRLLLGLGAVAPLHRACAERSLAHCPHLRGMADKALKPCPSNLIVAPILIPPKMPLREVKPVVSFLWLAGVAD